MVARMDAFLALMVVGLLSTEIWSATEEALDHCAKEVPCNAER